MPVLHQVCCCLCGAEAFDELIVSANDGHYGHGISIAGEPGPPKGWALLRVTIPEPVIDEKTEQLVDAMMDLPGTAQMAASMARLHASPSFHTTLYVCPGCQQGVLWDVVGTRLAEAVERRPAGGIGMYPAGTPGSVYRLPLQMPYQAELFDATAADADADDFDRETCPDCGKKVTRQVDPRQAGPKPFPGTWVNYRCECGYARDYVEDDDVVDTADVVDVDDALPADVVFLDFNDAENKS